MDKASKALQAVNQDMDAARAKIARQKEENKTLEIKIISKKRIQELPEPPRTLDGHHYKVPIDEYKNVKATAGQVDVLKEEYERRKKEQDKRDKALNRRSDELKEERKQLEIERQIPIKTQQELAVLRDLKKSITWLIGQPFVPELIRKLLTRALGGEELYQTMGRAQPEIKRKMQRQEAR